MQSLEEEHSLLVLSRKLLVPKLNLFSHLFNNYQFKEFWEEKKEILNFFRIPWILAMFGYWKYCDFVSVISEMSMIRHPKVLNQGWERIKFRNSIKKKINFHSCSLRFSQQSTGPLKNCNAYRKQRLLVAPVNRIPTASCVIVADQMISIEPLRLSSTSE